MSTRFPPKPSERRPRPSVAAELKQITAEEIGDDEEAADAALEAGLAAEASEAAPPGPAPSPVDVERTHAAAAAGKTVPSAFRDPNLPHPHPRPPAPVTGHAETTEPVDTMGRTAEERAASEARALDGRVHPDTPVDTMGRPIEEALELQRQRGGGAASTEAVDARGRTALERAREEEAARARRSP